MFRLGFTSGVPFQLNTNQDHLQNLIKVQVQLLNSGLSLPLPFNTNQTRANRNRPAATPQRSRLQRHELRAVRFLLVERGIKLSNAEREEERDGVSQVEHITKPQCHLNWQPCTTHSSWAG